MLAVMIGSFAGGLYAGFAGLKAFAFMTPSLINLPMWVGEGAPNNLKNALITMAISAVVSFIATWVIGFDDPVEEEKDTVKNIENHISQVESPVKGMTVPMSEVGDSMFSNGILGEGIAIKPTDGKIYAPVDGTVSATFETKHAIGIKSDDGLELLIHIGIDTVKLSGKPFKQFVEKDAQVKKGDLLIEFDVDEIEKAGLDPTVMVVVTNSKDYLEVLPTKETSVSTNDVLLRVI